MIEDQSDAEDDFDKFKAPYQAAECLVCLPVKNLEILLKDESVIAGLFDLIREKELKKTYEVFWFSSAKG